MPPAPILPPELQREILESAALLSTTSIPKLLLIAKRVKIWLEPLLYQVVVFRDPLPGHVCFTFQQLLAAIRSKPAYFAPDHVHHLYIDYGIFVQTDIEPLLAACTGVHNLVLINNDNSPRPWLLPRLSAMPLQRLSVNLTNLFAPAPVDFTHPLFAHITHLDLLYDVQGTWADWAGLTSMPRLTHLSFDPVLSIRMRATHRTMAPSILRGVLEHCPALRVLVLLWSPVQDSAMELDSEIVADLDLYALAQDQRLVIMQLASSYTHDWQTGARGGDDYWRRAEALVGLPPEVRSEIMYRS
ncbi:hypothetical protein C8R44DRAFT_871842 [Mycena epipterygia]|nr:hypothetical protein C8R44DRAFT_871842 [Mycena epipterygia]